MKYSEYPKAEKISEIQTGTPYLIPLLITKMEEKTSRQGRRYWSVTGTDGTDEITGNRFEDFPKDVDPKAYVGKVAYVIVEKNDYANIGKMCECRGRSAEEFVRKPPVEAEQMYQEIIFRLRSLRTPLKHLALNLYTKNRTKLLFWGNSEDRSLYSGLLYHAYRMMKASYGFAEAFPMAEKELLLLGCLLADIGKLNGLETEETGVSSLTSRGCLCGSAFLSVRMVEKEADVLRMEGRELPEEDLLILENMILARGGMTPATPEASLLLLLNQADREMTQFEDGLKNAEPGSVSDPVPAMKYRRLYRRSEKEEA